MNENKLSEAQEFVKDYVGLSTEEFSTKSNEELLHLVQKKMKEKLNDPNEMKIVTYPNKILTQKSSDVTEFTEPYQKFARQLLILCRRYGGLGLAAPQVSFHKRIIVIDTDMLDYAYNTQYTKNNYPQQIFNPIITNASGKIKFKEGCLSCPNVSGWVERFEKFTLNYQDETGNSKSLDITCGIGDPFGIVVQHEIDHLDGITFVDKLNFIDKDKAIKKLNKEREKK
jgi:peptide deformylase